jgi:4-amino-4-deoxy-L-arabinose transferase-like glycosyltransferase
MEPNPPALPNPPDPAIEPARRRRVFLRLALAVAALFLLGTHRYWVAADPNVDENTYLVAGKLLAQTGSPGFMPPDPYHLIGPMWIGTPEGRFYPKYPLGEPLLLAAAIKTFGPAAAFLVNPLLMTLTLLGVFLLVREAVGSSFAGLLAMLAMATSPTLLAETNDPDSHASSLCFTTWGMLLLLRWWRSGRLHQAVLAGLLLGLSTITRYTEGLLLLPVALVALFRLGRRWDRRTLAGTAALAVGWLLPVAGQVAFNLRVLHSPTGYDKTNESTAFSLGYFAHNWGMAVRQLFTLGLPLLLPLGLLGLLLLVLHKSPRERRLGAVLWAWTLPNLLLYISYYWTLGGVTYIRFFLTAFPPLVLGMAWLLTRPLPLGKDGSDRLRRWAQPAAAVALVLACGAFGVREVLPILKSDQQDRQEAGSAGAATLPVAPAGSVVFGPQPALLYLQYAGDYRLYSRNLFVLRLIAKLGKVDPTAPNTLQPERAENLFKLLKGRKNIGLWRLQRNLAADALSQGRRAFVIAPVGEAAWTRFAAPDLDSVDGRSFALLPVAGWTGWGPVRHPGEERDTVDWELLEVTASSAPPAGPSDGT